MNKAVLEGLGSILFIAAACNSVEAHQRTNMNHVRSQDYTAFSPLLRGWSSRNAPLEGPTADPSSTATGGPAGGLGS